MKLAPKIKINQDDATARGVFTPSNDSEKSITLKWVNTSGETQNAFFGDRSTLVALVHNLGTRVDIATDTAANSLVNATSSNRGVTPAAIESTLGFAPFTINEMIVKSTASSSQLDNDIEYLTADRSGNKDNIFIPLAEYTTENQYNEKIKRAKLPNELEMDGFSAIKFTLNAGETVSLTLKIKRTRNY